MTDGHLRSVQLDELEAEVSTVLAQQQLGAALEHVTQEDIGRLSGEGVLALYEAAAKAIETMGDEMKERIKRLEAALVEADEAMKTVAEVASVIREKGKLVNVQIEEATLLSKEIRDACATFRSKFGA